MQRCEQHSGLSEHEKRGFEEKFVFNQIFHLKMFLRLFINKMYMKDITVVFRS